MEKIILKMGKMNIQLVSNYNSPYYQSEAFGKLLNYVQKNYKRCQLKEDKNRRSLMIQQVDSVEKAYNILMEIQNT